MTPARHNLIKFLARVAVEQYINELSQSEKLSFNSNIECQPACAFQEQSPCLFSSLYNGDL